MRYLPLIKILFVFLAACLLITAIVAQNNTAQAQWAEKEQEYAQKITGQPVNVGTALYAYRVLDLGIEINRDYVKHPPDYIDVKHAFAYFKGFYLMFETDKGVDGSFTNNRLVLYLWKGTSWERHQEIILEDVDFKLTSGEHQLVIEGYTLSLHYNHDRESYNQGYYITLR